MFVKKLSNCQGFIANDGCIIQELLHPKNDPVKLPYSFAIATVEPRKSTYNHILKQTEMYFILSGQGRLHIDQEQTQLYQGDLALIGAEQHQWIENTGETDLIFAAIVSPPWTKEDDIRVD